MVSRNRLNDRYEIRDTVGQGGMGVVYRAYDLVVKREVAIKTLRDAPSQAALDLFQKEREVLASLSHPNIVEIFDVGEVEKGGASIPFFVMPLLPGMPLDKLIRGSSQPISVERGVEIIGQVCRGLQAAHEHGLVHRDLKPSNIFVMNDDSVKIIDFGVAHMVDNRSTLGQKGTLLYMAPEQIEMKPILAACDIFALGVVAYEMFTRRHPFQRAAEADIVKAILQEIPPPASELNPNLSRTVSQVVHKAIAKQPRHRFAAAREFGDTLRQAFRNEPIPMFDPARNQPRIQRARKAFDQGQFQFANEIVSELEAEGHLDSDLYILGRQITRAIRQKTVQELLESARRRLDEDEYTLALQKVEEILQVDPTQSAALSMKSAIEAKHVERQSADLLQLAQQRIESHAYTEARQELQKILQINPNDSKVPAMLTEVENRQKQYLKLRQQKEQAYEAARQAWQNGAINEALAKMESVLEWEKLAPETASSGRGATYQTFYDQVRAENEALNATYARARRCLEEKNFSEAAALCGDYLVKYPGNALFQALKVEVEERRRQGLSAFIVETDHRLEEETDLDKRIGLLKAALERFPAEPHFERSLRLAREKQDLVNSIVSRARLYEERRQYAEALGQWDILGSVYSHFPGLQQQRDRILQLKAEQAEGEARARAVAQIERQIKTANFEQALELLEKARAEFPAATELDALEEAALQGKEQSGEVERLLAGGQALCRDKRFDSGIEMLSKAFQIDTSHLSARAALSNALVEQAHDLVETDVNAAEALINRALQVDPGHALAKNLQGLVAERKRQQAVRDSVERARQLEAAGDLESARQETQRALSAYPQEPQLTQLLTSLESEPSRTARQETRQRDVGVLKTLELRLESVTELQALTGIAQQARGIAAQYPEDAEVQRLATEVSNRVATLTPPPDRSPSPAPRETYILSPASQAAPLLSGVQTSPPARAGRPLPASAPIPFSGAAQPQGAEQPSGARNKVWIAAATLVALGVGLALFLTLRHHPAPPANLAVASNSAPAQPEAQPAAQPESSVTSQPAATAPAEAPASNRRAPVKVKHTETASGHENSKKESVPSRHKQSPRSNEEADASQPPPAPPPAAAAPAGPAMGVVDFLTVPPGLTVHVDGAVIGRTPLEQSYPVGSKHNVTIDPPPGLGASHYSFQTASGNHQKEVDYRTAGWKPASGETASTPVASQASPGALGTGIFSTTPPGATVEIAGKTYTTPFSVMLPAGSHKLKVSRPGYKSIEENLYIPAGHRVPWHKSLSPQ
jgi:serine/threonine protein kinase